jgi:tRNA nucleotidyltransferase (CCA-adding enzyme)
MLTSMSAESAVLEKIRPDAEEDARIKKAADDLVKTVKDYISVHDLDIKVRLVGSYAKGTYLSAPDLDLFMLFPEGTPHSILEDIGLQAGEDILHGIRMYSEHPYTRGVFEGVSVDLVPSIALKNTLKLQTAVDRTPFHTDYILSKLDDAKKDQVRLLKAFMKGIEAYGAEPNTRGFSGYLCELLIVKYGSFDEVLEAASDWREGTTIVIEKKGPPMIGPLVVYDPVDERRNVASAVHIDTMSLFIVAAKAYLEEPSERFFFPHKRVPLTKEELQKKTEEHGSRIMTVIFKRPDVIEDNLYSQLWKTQYALTKKLNDFDYNVLRAVHNMTDDTLEIAFEIERDVLSKTYKHAGPPVFVKTAASFLNKWKDNEYGKPFIEDGCWNVIAERMYFTAQEMITDEAAISGIGREIDPDTMKILDHDASVMSADPELLTELLDPIQIWER